MSKEPQISLLFLAVFFLAVVGSLIAGLYIGASLPSGKPAGPPPPVTSDPLHLRTDPESILRIGSEEHALSLREQLIQFIWSGNGFPKDILPAHVEESIVPEEALPEGLARVDRLTVEMPHGVNSIVQVFYPPDPNGHLLLYHEGHGHNLNSTNIDFFLQKRYTVAAIRMPLYGENSKPVVRFPRFGHVRLDTHDHFELFESPQFTSIRFFVEPVAITLNHLRKSGSYERVHMTGLSGGGWTTAIYAAIDPRVQTSVPVAGTLPLYLRSSKAHDRGDFEQFHPALYRIANRLELYVLGAWGEGRAQLQIFNRDDPCCFGGERGLLYREQVSTAVTKIGAGDFSVWIDTTHTDHAISPAALARIDDLFQRR